MTWSIQIKELLVVQHSKYIVLSQKKQIKVNFQHAHRLLPFPKTPERRSD